MKKWCNRCNRYHDSIPLDENMLIEKHSREIALEIDRQVMENLKMVRIVTKLQVDKQGCHSSIRDLKKDKKQGKGADSAVYAEEPKAPI